MLSLVVPDLEFFNDNTQEFVAVKGGKLQLEHSLVSLAKWESKWKKPFFKHEQKTAEELLDYIRCMTVNQNVQESVYQCLTSDHIKKIKSYIEDPMTATTISNPKKSSGDNTIPTAEILYYYMIAFNIPFECQKWHLNRLIMLIRVCGIKNSKPKKMNKQQYFEHRRQLNEQRRNAAKAKRVKK